MKFSFVWTRRRNAETPTAEDVAKALNDVGKPRWSAKAPRELGRCGTVETLDTHGNSLAWEHVGGMIRLVESHLPDITVGVLIEGKDIQQLIHESDRASANVQTSPS